jgi:hypothetical protein
MKGNNMDDEGELLEAAERIREVAAIGGDPLINDSDIQVGELFHVLSRLIDRLDLETNAWPVIEWSELAEARKLLVEIADEYVPSA